MMQRVPKKQSFHLGMFNGQNMTKCNVNAVLRSAIAISIAPYRLCCKQNAVVPKKNQNARHCVVMHAFMKKKLSLWQMFFCHFQDCIKIHITCGVNAIHTRLQKGQHLSCTACARWEWPFLRDDIHINKYKHINI